MTDQEALIRCCLASPEDDSPRLILADWLEEHGQEDAWKLRKKGKWFLESIKDHLLAEVNVKWGAVAVAGRVLVGKISDGVPKCEGRFSRYDHEATSHVASFYEDGKWLCGYCR